MSNKKEKIMLEFYVYILRCIDGTYYTGQTDDIEARISQHRQGLIQTCYTFTRLPIQVVYVTTFASRGEAIEAEQTIKGWSRRKKEALINEQYELLRFLSLKKFNKKKID